MKTEIDWKTDRCNGSLCIITKMQWIWHMSSDTADTHIYPHTHTNVSLSTIIRPDYALNA